jgi:hypothetical protein
MKKYELFYFAVNLMVIFSCSNSKDKVSALTEIYIDPSQVESAYDIAGDIESDWDMVVLETSDDCLIGNIDKLIYRNNIYYLLDNNGNTVFLFDSKGKFISKLHKKGTGPDEYSQLGAFCIVGKNIWVSDSYSWDLICYDENLKMVERHRTFGTIHVGDMVTVGENICIADNYSGWNEQNMQCGLFDTANKKITAFLYNAVWQDKKIVTFKKTNQLGVFENSCLFIHSYCDTIYQLKDDQFAPAYKVVFSERYEDIPLPIEKIMDPSLSKIIRGMECIKQTRKNIIIGYFDGQFIMTVLYNKDKGESKVYSHLANSNINGLKSFPHNTFFDGVNVISVSEAEAILNFYTEEDNLSKIKNESDKIKIKTIISSIDQYSNPVLIHYKLKEDSNL